jgi:HK97 gp10 family phage protein
MADPVTIEIHGLREIQAKLQQLPGQVARRVVYGALRKGAAVIRKAAAQNAPVRSGTLRKGFKISRSRIHRGPEKFGVCLTLKKGKGRSDKADPFYGRWVESGYRVGKKTVKVKVARSDRPGRTRTVRRGEHEIPGQYFVRRALQSQSQAAIDAIVAEANIKAQQLINDMGL